MYVHIPLPRLASDLVAHLLGTMGLLCVAVAVGGLAGWWWSLLVGGVEMVGVSVVYLAGADAKPTPAAAGPERQPRRAA